MAFKECPNCRHAWSDRADFLSDPSVDLMGYQVNYVHLEAGYFMFNHNTKECGTSMGISAEAFLDMHQGPIFEDNPKHEVDDCPGYCDERHIVDPCDLHCECSYVRDVLEKVKKWPKAAVSVS